MMNYSAARREVLKAAREGRAMYVPAGSRNNAAARILIDGVDVGEASMLGHYVTPEPGRIHQVVPLLPIPDWNLPPHLQGL